MSDHIDNPATEGLDTGAPAQQESPAPTVDEPTIHDGAEGGSACAYGSVEDPIDSIVVAEPNPSVSSTYGNTFAYATPAASYGAPVEPLNGQGATSSPSALARLVPTAVVAIVAGLIGGYVGSQVYGGNAADSVVVTGVSSSSGLQQLPPSSSHSTSSIARIAAAVLPTVVSVNTTSPAGDGTGSGEIIKSDSGSSYVLTNNHVIIDVAQSGGTIEVQFQDGSHVVASLVGRDPSYDLAVLKIARGNLPVIPFGNSDSVVVGDSVVAIGSPLGLTGTVTSGIVSALHRPVTTNPSDASTEESFISAIQTDAAINPGNSGGPLVDSAGRMVGVNSAIATLGQSSNGQSGNIGVGFSIPINQARRVADEIMRTGKSRYPVIGVSLDSAYEGEGARIRTVTPGGPAEAAGLRIGDVVRKVNGAYMANLESVITAIRSNAPGDRLSLTIARGGRTFEVTLTLASRLSMG